MSALKPKTLKIRRTSIVPASVSEHGILFADEEGYISHLYSSGYAARITSPLNLTDDNIVTLSDVQSLIVPRKTLVNLGNQEAQFAFLPRAQARKWWSIFAAGSSFVPAGITGVTTSGTLSEDNDDQTTSVKLETAAAANSIAQLYSTNLDVAAFAYTQLSVLLKTGNDISNIRILCGIFDSTSNFNDNIGSNKGVYFRYSTTANDPGWVGIGHRNSSSGREITDALETIEADTTYLLNMWVWDDEAVFSVNNGSELSVSQLPSPPVKLGFWVVVVNTGSAAKATSVSRVHCETG